jgi:inosose dehydratase
VTGLARRVGTTSGPRDEARPFARGLAPDGPLGRASLGVVPIVWNNVDLPDISPATPVPEVLDEIARLGFDGCQLGSGFPVGDELRFELAARDLRLAEVYVSLPATEAGPTPEAGEIGRERLGLLTGAGGEVLVVALDLSPERAAVAGRADAAGVPRLAPDGWDRIADVVNELAEAADAAGARLAFHPHAGTYVETPAEVEQLLDRTDPGGVGLCLDTGHWRVGGGDPAAGLRRHAARLHHVHLKDVAAEPLAELSGGRLGGFLGALRARVFTELGTGLLDLDAVLAVLADRDYDGWLMLEQDTTWRPPSESVAIGRSALEAGLRRLDAAGHA